MPDDKNALKAGLFIVVAVALIFGVWVMIKGLGTFTEDQQVNTVAFDLSDDIGGLKEGGEVRIGGYKVGVVTEIKVHQPQGEASTKPAKPQIFVTIKVPERLDIRRDAVARVQSTVTGQAWVNFDELGTGAKLKPKESIEGRAGGINALIAQLGSLTPELKQTLADASATAAELKRLSATLNAKAGPLADQFSAAAATGKDALAEARDALRENRPTLKQTLADARDLADLGKKKLPNLIDQADKLIADGRTALAKADTALDTVKAVLGDAKAVSATARTLVVDNKGRIQQVVEGVQRTASNLEAASASIRSSPWRLLYKPSNSEKGNLDLFDSARQFAQGANDLQGTATALRDALADPASDKGKLQRLMNQLDQKFAEFNRVQSTLFDKIKE